MAKRRPAKKKTSKVSKETATRKANRSIDNSLFDDKELVGYEPVPLRLAAQTRYLNYSLLDGTMDSELHYKINLKIHYL